MKDSIDKFGPLTEKVTRIYTRQVLEGLCYIHTHRIIHRDMKCREISLAHIPPQQLYSQKRIHATSDKFYTKNGFKIVKV